MALCCRLQNKPCRRFLPYDQGHLGQGHTFSYSFLCFCSPSFVWQKKQTKHFLISSPLALTSLRSKKERHENKSNPLFGTVSLFSKDNSHRFFWTSVTDKNNLVQTTRHSKAMANEERINNPSISFLRLLTNLHNLHHNQSILKSYKKKEKKKGRKTKKPRST